jgi:antitoxin component of MazEF toxin-antitoxin module
MSKQSILKWGNSLGFRLPAEVARQMNVSEGGEVTYRLDGRRLVIEAAAPELPPFTEADMAHAIRRSKPRLAPSFGKRRGKEAW